MTELRVFGDPDVIEALPGEPIERPEMQAVFYKASGPAAEGGAQEAVRKGDAPEPADREAARYPLKGFRLPPSATVSRQRLASLVRERPGSKSQDDAAPLRRALERGAGVGPRLSVDVPLSAARQGGPSWYLDGTAPRIGTRAQAQHHLSGLVPGTPADCDDVGVIIFDVGVSADYVAAIGGTFGGGLGMEPIGVAGSSQGSSARPGEFHDPHARAADGHGNMIARNVLGMAPSATIYDVPVLPDRVSDVRGFASFLMPLLDATIALITGENLPDGTPAPEHRRWILVNAWAVATSFADLPGPLAAIAPLQDIRYMDNRAHALNLRFAELAAMENVDVVFAAGNAGAHAPDPFSGPYDRGPHRAIKGANGLMEVWTVGAVDVGAMPIAMSSEGPSLSALMPDPGPFGDGLNRKPDVSAPSWFAEDEDVSIVNTGTSAACGLFAGALACLRSGAGPGLPERPERMALRPGARWSRTAGSPI